MTALPHDDAPVTEDTARAAVRRAQRRERLRWAPAVLLLLAVSFALRVWGAKQGLPYAYNADENAHFVPKAIGLFGHGLNPHYFVNPPAYTYLLHVVFAVWFGGREGVSNSFAADPTDVFFVARIVAAACGTIAVWLLYLAGTKLFADRRVGLPGRGPARRRLPAGLLLAPGAQRRPDARADLPRALWHGGHRAPGAAGRLPARRRGPRPGLRDQVHRRDRAAADPRRGRRLARRPPAIARLDGHRGPGDHRLRGARRLPRRSTPMRCWTSAGFRDGLQHQTSVADDALGKLGLTEDNGLAYYLWTLTWGLGWVPAIAAGAGVVLLVRDNWRIAAVLVPAPLLFLLFMGTQERFFGRWLMPVFPMICLLAAYAVLRVIGLVGRRRPALVPTLMVLATAALCGQGLIASLHIGQVLSRPDTRNLARAWLVANVPPKTKIVVEPVVPDGWAQDIGHPSPLTSNGNRWVKFPTSRSNIANDGSEILGPGRIVNIEDYERTLYPGLVDRYEEQGYCWVVVGSTQRGRAEVEPEAVPRALAYYRELERRADTAYVASPYRSGADPVDFNFDWSFDFYPLAYHRPGPMMWIYHLRGGRCATG